MERFARFFGYDSRDAFAKDLLGHLKIVQGHYEKLFEGDPAGTAKLPAFDYGAGPADKRLLEFLATLGFKKPVMVAETVRQWMAGDVRALRVEATRTAFVEFIPALIDGLAHAEQPDNAVVAFDRFLQALQRGGRLISLLSQNRDLVALVALVLGAAPRLGDMLARQPQLMDGLIDPRFFGAMPDQRELSARLTATLADANSYEEFLDRLRLFGQESLFLIGARILSGTVSAQHASVAFADVAEGIVHTVHGLVTDQFAAQHGRIKGQQTAILAMGKLGSREMTASSDLDLILIYDFDHEEPDSDGARPLQGAQYFARLTQRLISAFTTRTNYGVLYDVDMRLRPSGRAGPLASRLDSFAEYQDREAWTWEHMALTRARVISASREFRGRIENVIREVLTRPRDRARDRQRRRRDAPRHRAGKGRGRYLGSEIRRRRHDRYRVHRPVPATGARRRAPRNSRRRHAAGAGPRRAARRAAAIGGRGAAPGRAALSRPHANPAALRDRKIQAGNRGRRPAAGAGARGRRAGFFLAARRGCGRRKAR